MSLGDRYGEAWEQAYTDIMTDLYREAVPGVELDSLEDMVEEADQPEEGPPIYLQHFLDEDTQEELIEDVLEEYGIEDDYDVFEAKKAVFLGSGPSTNLSTVDNAREDYDLEPVSEMLDGEGDTE
ncbi:hypothetical protein KY092_08110 [Natronomonas gomsonensis]|uniref:hypothetical protein n=1 Tax=Natronomonas gomsonensis TaxID=1046043 RepID=UPI0020CA2F23|nr:hypothetical protein [Natronomonas gomsonensis]MCY4730521.1 hypothetical protein [Natronomonas gomsonensis]